MAPLIQIARYLCMLAAKLRFRPRVGSALLAWTLSTSLPGLAQPAAPTPEFCEICQARFVDKIYYAQDPIREIKRHFCKACSDSPDTCWACDLPVIARTRLALDDGRLLCQWDKEGIITSPTEAQNLFFQHLLDWQRLLAAWPPLPNRNVHFHLVNRDDFLREYSRRPHLDHPDTLQGLTYSGKDKDGKPEHHIYILTGLLRNQFLAVGAHEFAHAWLYEHADLKRQLHKDTTEGFCEWMAYRYMTILNDEIEKNRILDNTYTRGQVHALLDAEKQHTTYRLVQWTLEGVDSWLDRRELDRILVVRRPIPATPQPLPTTAVVTPVPDELTLKGISTAGQRRFALINNQTLSEGESGKVRVGATNLMVRCLEIRPSSVLVRVTDEAQPRELFLAPPPPNPSAP